jgi:hypothetical protein
MTGQRVSRRNATGALLGGEWRMSAGKALMSRARDVFDIALTNTV